MAEVRFRRKIIIYQPAAVGSDETQPVMTVKKGWRVIGCMVTPLINSAGTTNSTFTLGDDTDPDGYVTSATIDLEAAVVGTWIDGIGAYLLETTAAVSKYGHLYLVDDTIDVVYTANTAGATNPRVKIVIDYIPLA